MIIKLIINNLYILSYYKIEKYQPWDAYAEHQAIMSINQQKNKVSNHHPQLMKMGYNVQFIFK